MSISEQALVSFFVQVAQKDQDQLEKLKCEKSFSVSNERWCFTLPDLYSFLRDHDSEFRRIEYKHFLQMLFNCLINQTIKAYGAEITIIKNLGKIDKSSYALVWHSA